MKTQTALVGADGVVELDAVTSVHMNLAVVIGPWHLECKDAVGLHHTFHNLGILEFGMQVIDRFNTNKHFTYCLKVLLLARMPAFQVGHNVVYIHIAYINWFYCFTNIGQ